MTSRLEPQASSRRDPAAGMAGIQRIYDQRAHSQKLVDEQEVTRKRLELYRDELDNLSLQATLLLGFTVASIGADTFSGITDMESSFCVYKSNAHMAVGALFMFSTVVCVACCMFVLVLGFKVHQHARHTFLHVGQIIKSVTKKYLEVIEAWYIAALGTFGLSTILTLWLFVGLPHYVDAEDADAMDAISTRDDRLKLKCLDVTSDAHLARRDAFGSAVAGVSTVILCGATVYGVWTLERLRAEYSIADIDQDRVNAEQRELDAADNLRDAKRAMFHEMKKGEMKEVAPRGLLKWSDPAVQGAGEKAAEKLDELRQKSRATAKDMRLMRRLDGHVSKHMKITRPGRMQKTAMQAQRTATRAVSMPFQAVSMLSPKQPATASSPRGTPASSYSTTCDAPETSMNGGGSAQSATQEDSDSENEF